MISARPLAIRRSATPSLIRRVPNRQPPRAPLEGLDIEQAQDELVLLARRAAASRPQGAGRPGERGAAPRAKFLAVSMRQEGGAAAAGALRGHQTAAPFCLL
ncbi:hypothetical protein [Bradyrhizobium diazoefficiens]|uniref:hypothetical protein n=1 Tax=Bradyrhizobium diazoefficiens TaxID=1355477 RepID=UPI003832DFEA